jgi:micrococcal nuclease
MKTRMMGKLIMFLFAFFIGLYSRTLTENPIHFSDLSSSPPFISEATQSGMLYPVTKIIDGDTIKITMNGKDETVRLLGVDTPELVDPRKPVQCFAASASAETKRLLTGASVSLEIDPTQGDRDRYGRLLAYVLLPEGINVSELLIRNGFAHEYTYENNPHRYQVKFLQAENEAREEKRGLWADGACP